MRWQQTLLLGAIGVCVGTAVPGYGVEGGAGVEIPEAMKQQLRQRAQPIICGIQYFRENLRPFGDDLIILFTQGQEKQRQRDPQAAIAAYQEVIEKYRDEIEFSAPALVNLVACFQLLKGDASAGEDYARLSAKYLSKPPPLDGASVLGLEQAKDDILWKAWFAPVPPKVGMNVSECDGTRRIKPGSNTVNFFESSSTGGGGFGGCDYEFKDDIVTKVSGICHTQHVASGRMLLMLGDLRKMKPSGNTCTLQPSLLVCEDSMLTRRSSAAAEMVDLSLIDQKGRKYEMDIRKSETDVKNVPRALAQLAAIRGHVRLTKPLTFKSAVLKLKPGETATLGTRRYTVKSANMEQVKGTRNNNLHVVYAITDTAPHSQEGHSAMARMNQEFDPTQAVLCTEAGRRFAPVQRNPELKGTRYAVYRFVPSDDEPAYLLFQEIVEVSTRVIPFEFKDVDVP